MPRVISLEVIGGLGNRLMALVSGICLAEDLQTNIIIFWPSNNPKCAAAFSELFQPCSVPNWVRVVEGVAPNQKRMCITQKEALEAIQNNIPILSWADFHKTDPLRWRRYLKNLLPVLEILNNVRNNFHKLPKNYIPIGVHVRRTDCERAILESPLQAFILVMAPILNGYFYIASDDNEVVSQLKKAFPTQVYCHETLRNRNSVEGIKEAMVSLYTLAHCSRVLGSFASSFSRIAAQLGSKECQIIRSSK